MLVMEMPNLPPQNAPVMIAQANQAKKAELNKERVMGVCFGVNYNPTGQQYSAVHLAPEYSAAGYLGLYENRMVNPPPSNNAELVAQPQHGKVTYARYEDGSQGYDYIPNLDYVGDDKIVFQVNVDGKIVKLIYMLKVSKTEVSNQSDDVFCKKTGTQWKISLPNAPIDTVATGKGSASLKTK